MEHVHLTQPLVLVEKYINNDKVEAFNLMVQFLHLAQKRGAFTIPESAKLNECIVLFSVPPSTTTAELEPGLLE